MKSRLFRSTLLVSLTIVIMGVSFLTGYYIRDRMASYEPDLDLVKEAYSLLLGYYFGELPDDLSLQRGMIHGMVGTIGDPHTIYVEPIAHELQKDELAGQYGGIGAYINRDEEGAVHLIPFQAGPAFEAGIHESDILLAIDGLEISVEMTLDEVISLVRGPIGTDVVLSLSRDSREDEIFQITLQRIAIDIPSVTSYIVPDHQEMGVLVITRFSDKTASEVATAFDKLYSEGIQGLILDLRGNSGGILDAAIEVSKFFLNEGIVLIDRQAIGQDEIFRNDTSGKGAQIPMVVLVDGGTASAAEVVAAAIESYGRAPLIGTRTYGKGSVQSILTIQDGSSLHITVARWLTPDGQSLDGVGLLPDIGISTSEPQRDIYMDTGIEVLSKEIQGGDS